MHKSTTARASFWRFYGWPLLAAWAASATLRAFLTGVWSIGGDFLSFYDTSVALRTGVSPYTFHLLGHEPNLNAPSVLFLFWPLSLARPQISLLLWQVVQAICLGCAAALIAAELRIQARVVMAAAFATAAAETGLQLGQWTGALTLLVTAVWLADRRGRHIAAGLWFGLALYAKPFLLVLVPWWAWRRRWSSIAAAAVTAALAASPGALLLGKSSYREWGAALARVYWFAHPLNASAFGYFDRVLGHPTPFSEPFIAAPLIAVTLSRAFAVTIAAIVVVRLHKERDPDVTMALLILTALLLSPLGWSYYAVILAGPLAALAVRRPVRGAPLGMLGYVLLCVPYAVRFRFGPLVSALYGSVYWWSAVALFVGVYRTQGCCAWTGLAQQRDPALSASQGTG
jgi:hypothetical protein